MATNDDAATDTFYDPALDTMMQFDGETSHSMGHTMTTLEDENHNPEQTGAERSQELPVGEEPRMESFNDPRPPDTGGTTTASEKQLEGSSIMSFEATPHVTRQHEEVEFPATEGNKDSRIRRGSTQNQDQETNKQTHEQYSNPDSSEHGKSEYDSIAHEAAILLDKKLDSNRAGAKSLLRHLTMYVKILHEVQAEFERIQRIEHQESERLDQVEPEVQGATSHLLDYPSMGGNHPSSS